MPRAGLSRAAVVDAALAVVDATGADGLTLAAVAGRCGVVAPSLYKHIGGLPELRTLVGHRVLDEMTDRFTRAVLGRSRDDAVAALLREYRAYAREHPARYAAMPANPLGDPASAAAGERLIGVFLAVLRGFGLSGPAAIHAIRCARALAHGFVAIELGGGFGLPEDVDDTYERLIRMYLTSLNGDTPA